MTLAPTRPPAPADAGIRVDRGPVRPRPPRGRPARIGDAGARALLHRLLRRVRHGRLTIVDASGRSTFGDGDGPHAAVEVHDPAAYRAVATRGSVGLGGSYLAGAWDCDDLVALVRVLARNLDGLDRLRDAVAPLAAGLDRLRRVTPDPARDRANVRAHYDLGDDFFACFLDETMSYSAAWFDTPTTTLGEASVAKLDRICRKLGLRPGDEVVEIGSGWGGFAVHAAERYGAHVTTTTVSARQRSYAAERVRAAGLADRVTVLGDDYRDLRGRFDKLVSIEMIEAVDWRDHDTFFAACDRLLRDDGLMVLQAITVPDRRFDAAKRHEDFVKRFVFPGGCLPSTGAMARSVQRATTLDLVDLEDLGPHYARTLAAWRANLDEHAGQVRALGFDEAFLRMWGFYLAYCEAAFRERRVSDVQVVLAKPGWRSDPAGGGRRPT